MPYISYMIQEQIKLRLAAIGLIRCDDRDRLWFNKKK